MIPAERQRHGAAFAILSNFLPTHGTKVLDGSIVTLCELAKVLDRSIVMLSRTAKYWFLNTNPRTCRIRLSISRFTTLLQMKPGYHRLPLVLGSRVSISISSARQRWVVHIRVGEWPTRNDAVLIVSIFTKHPRWRNSSKLKKEVVWRRDGILFTPRI